ncbi:hypothetical protein [Paenibacillus elgii]|uniref:hypothetical protein n=1 Tax=Paenibacillus elgii TaxID=189691 RepID=UPI0012FA867C|nr:hypothetical protein [Paenibacillus elgii]
MSMIVNPDEVLESYLEYSVTPLFGRWVNKDTHCLCALSVLVLARLGGDWSLLSESLAAADEQAMEVLCLDSDFVTGFVKGYDGYGPPVGEPFITGYENGKLIRNAIIQRLDGWIEE